MQIQTRRHTVQALSDVALSVGHGEVVGLVGESGGGKTMIARSIIAALPRGARVSGTVRLEGREVLGLSGRELMEHRGGGAALCFQNPRRALAPIRTIGNQLADRLAVHRGLDGAAARAEALRLLRDVGLRNPEQRYGAYPHELSGGMSQRVMIAAALACRPRLLLADEPTTGLDVTLTRDILELFRAVADEQDRGVLLVSHDIAAIAEFCDRLVVLYAGSVVEDGPTGEVLARPAHPYTRTLLDAVPELDGGPVVATGGSMPLLATVPTSCPFAPRCARAADDCRAERPLLTAAGDGRDVACFHPLAESTRTVSMVSHPARSVPAADAPVVRVRDLHVEFRGRLGAKAHHVLHGVDLTVGPRRDDRRRRRERVAARPRSPRADGAGAAVSGKRRGRRHRHRRGAPWRAATLPRHGADGVPGPGRLAQPAAHRRRRRSANRCRPSGCRRRSRTAVSPSSSAASASTRRSSAAVRTSCPAARPSASPSPAPCRWTPPSSCSTSPTSALDVTVQAQILELVAELAASADRTFVFISHDLAVVRSMCDRVAVLYLGRIVEHGTAAELFAHPLHPYTRALLAGAPLTSTAGGRPPKASASPASSTRRRPARRLPAAPRCPFAADVCAEEPPLAPSASGRLVACWRADEIDAATAVSVAARPTPTVPGPS